MMAVKHSSCGSINTIQIYSHLAPAGLVILLVLSVLEALQPYFTKTFTHEGDERENV